MGGDPINSSDPFGLSPDTLDYGDDDAIKWVQDIEADSAGNPKAYAVFQALKASPYHHLIFNADKLKCPGCIGSGYTVDTEALGVDQWFRDYFPGMRTVTGIRPSHPDAVADGVLTVVWHEGIHAMGVPAIGRLYRHGSGSRCDAAFVGVPRGCRR